MTCQCKTIINSKCKHEWQDKGLQQEIVYSNQLGSLGSTVPNWVLFLFCKKCHLLKKIYAKVLEA